MGTTGSTTHRRINSEENQFCYWLKASESRAHIETAATCIAAVIAAITLITGVLLLLASHGINLAGINTIAQKIQVQWIYLTLATAGSLLTLMTALIIAQVHRYLNRTYSEKESLKLNQAEHIHNRHMLDETDGNNAKKNFESQHPITQPVERDEAGAHQMKSSTVCVDEHVATTASQTSEASNNVEQEEANSEIETKTAIEAKEKESEEEFLQAEGASLTSKVWSKEQLALRESRMYHKEYWALDVIHSCI